MSPSEHGRVCPRRSRPNGSKGRRFTWEGVPCCLAGDHCDEQEAQPSPGPAPAGQPHRVDGGQRDQQGNNPRAQTAAGAAEPRRTWVPAGLPARRVSGSPPGGGAAIRGRTRPRAAPPGRAAGACSPGARDLKPDLCSSDRALIESVQQRPAGSACCSGARLKSKGAITAFGRAAPRPLASALDEPATFAATKVGTVARNSAYNLVARRGRHCPWRRRRMP